MPRIARIVTQGFPYHITHRGNNKQDIFFVDDDRKTYLEILKRQSSKYGLTIMGYCLMRNHIHLIAIPQNSDSLANAVGRTHFVYTQYINSLHNRSGHLWQGRFYSCILDDQHFLSAMRYIEHNPVRAKLCQIPWDYEWSSAAIHAGTGGRPGLIDVRQWFRIVSASEWKDILANDVDEEELRVFRQGILNGRPLGSDSFLSKLETSLGRRLRPLPVGRPRTRKFAKNDIKE